MKIYFLIFALFLVSFSARAQTESVKQLQTAEIKIEAAIVFQNGDVVPLARTPIYLLSESLELALITDANKILIKQDVEKLSGDSRLPLPPSITEVKTLKEFINAIFAPVLYPTYSEAALQQIRKATKFEATTDFQGRVVFSQIPLGTYYLFTATSVRKNRLIWHLKTEVAKDGAIILDQANRLQ